MGSVGRGFRSRVTVLFKEDGVTRGYPFSIISVVDQSDIYVQSPGRSPESILRSGVYNPKVRRWSSVLMFRQERLGPIRS